jgi:chemotaxis protein MotB
MKEKKTTKNMLKDGVSNPEAGAAVSTAKSPKPDLLETYYAGLAEEEGAQMYHRGRSPRRVVWSIAWSDLMMTMFILFAVLYIYQAANREFSFMKEVETAVSPETVPEIVPPPQVETLIESVAADPSRIDRKDSDIIHLRNISDIGTVELQEDKAVRVIIPGDLLFAAGRADLKTSSLFTLREVADALRITDYRVNVVGHTDNIPMHSEKFATNWELSTARACAVARFLIEKMRLSPQRFYVSGYAYLQPVAPNDTSKHRAANRRVELILTKKRPEPTAISDGAEMIERGKGKDREKGIGQDR